MGRKAHNLIGKTFGRLKITSLHSRTNKQSRWNYICVCGAEGNALGNNLMAGTIQSCGCWRKTSRLKHGDDRGTGRTKEYGAWRKIKERCYSKTCKKYPSYGGRGITVCEQWRHSYENFLADMGRAPSIQHSIDRIDNNGHYEPGNCRWATSKEQGNNKRNNILLEFNGQTKNIYEWSALFGLTGKLIRSRINTGWSVADTLLTPKLKHSSLRGAV